MSFSCSNTFNGSHPFTHQLLSAYHMPSTVPGAVAAVAGKTTKPVS